VSHPDELMMRAAHRLLEARLSWVTAWWVCTGCGMRNMDTALLIGKGGLVPILQDYYPERLSCIYVINADWIFKILFKIVSPFLDDRTRHKIVMVNTPNPDLQQHFTQDSLPVEYRQQIFGA
jgi:hypothetical protein